MTRRTLQSITIAFSFLIIILSFQNCSEHTEYNGSDESNSLFMDELEAKALIVLNQNCASCHGADATDAPVDILNVDKMIEDGYIVMGEPQNSSLYVEVIDGTMPISAPLSEADKDALKSWLLADNGLTDDLSAILAPPDPESGGAEPATFLQVQAVLSFKCASCHMNGNSQGGVSLDTFNQVRTYVSPGLPGSSSLYEQVGNNLMPPNNPLAGSEKQIIFSWISDGAPNN